MDDEDDDGVILANNHRGSTPQPSIYRSTQSNLNAGSQQTIYQSVRNTLYDDAISLEVMSTAGGSTEERLQADDVSTLRGTTETVLEGSCGDLRSGHDGGGSRLVRQLFSSLDIIFSYIVL